MKSQDIVGRDLAAVLPKQTRPWFLEPHLLKLNLILLIPFLSSTVAGYDGSLMNGLQSTSSWKLRFGNPAGARLGVVNASQSLGNLAALPFVGPLSDRFGRRWVVLVGSAMVVIASIIQACSVDYAMFVASRLLVGIGSGLLTLPSPVIIAELAYPTHRGRYTSLFWCGFHLGALLAGWTTYGCQRNLADSDWAWRIPSIVQAALPLIQVLAFVLLPESPRWLVANGRMDEARKILAKYHTRSGSTDVSHPLVSFEMVEIETAIRQEQEAKETAWKALVQTAGNRKRTTIAACVGAFALWNGTTVMSVYLTLTLDLIGITDANTQTLINGIITLFNFVVASTATLAAIERLGRRSLFLWSTVGMLVFFVAWTACSAVISDSIPLSSPSSSSSSLSSSSSHGVSIATLVFIFAYSFMYDVAYTPLLFGYPTEIFPYSLRAKGLSVMLFVFYSSLVVLAFVNPIGLDALGWRYYLVFCVILALMLVVTWFLFPETRGHSLEEVAEVFDGARTRATVNAMPSEIEDGEATVIVAMTEKEAKEKGL